MSPSLRVLACASLLILVCATAVVVADTVVSSADGSLGCEFKSSGGSGSVVVLTNQTKNDGSKLDRSFEIRWDKIEEQNPSGNKVQDASGYAVDAALWQGPTGVTFNGVAAQRIHLSVVTPRHARAEAATRSASRSNHSFDLSSLTSAFGPAFCF
jgi:opacity protein-like surface antigen